jgi:ATP-binding cassette subfamily F protein 3
VLRGTNLARQFGARTLFSGVELAVHQGDRIGLVGPNGAGKTTLLKILAGLEPPDDGRVDAVRGLRAGYLRQEIDPGSERTVIEETRTALAPLHALEAEMAALEAEITRRGDAGAAVEPGLAARYERLRVEYERRGGYRAEADLRATLVGLGLGPERWERPLRELSGGWIMRVELARLLVARPDVLLLDEPTNHLDLPSIAWFEGVLRDWPGAAVVVSHDRTFLDRHATAIAELDGGTVRRYSGNYSAYLAQKEARGDEAAQRVRSLDRQIAHAERFVERFGVKASKARQAQSLRKRIARLEGERGEIAGVAAPKRARGPRFRFPQGPRSGDVALRLEGVAKAYGPLVVYEGLDLEIRRAERIALVGPNGAGKSTLLRLCAGTLAPDAGTREPGHNVRIGFYAQHQLDALDATRTVLEELAAAASIDDVPRLRGLAGAFLFSGDDVEKRVSVLSGGEKARLALARLLLARANLLVLDEPTNHLDLKAREVLAEALGAFEGTLVFISHDRTLVNALATRVLEVTRTGERSSVRSFPGGWDAYEERVARERSRPAAASAPEPAAEGAGDGAAPPARERRKRRTFTLERLRARAAEAERAIAALEAEIEQLGWRTADPETLRDGERVRALVATTREREQQRDELYREWERLIGEIGDVEGS